MEQLYCALNLEQNQSGEFLQPGGCRLPEPDVCFPTDSKANSVQPPATFGISPGEKGSQSGSFRGPAGVFPGGWRAEIPQPGRAEDPSPPSNPTPSNLTPGESQHASSATSYSPTLEDGRKTHHINNSASTTAYITFPNGQDGTYIRNSSCTSNRDDSSNGSLPMPKDQNSNNDDYNFAPGGWDFSNGTRITPLPASMSPPAAGQWASSNVLPLPVWSNNRSKEDQTNVDWKANRRDPPRYGYKSGFLMDTGIPDPNGKDPFQIDFYNDTENSGQNQRR